MEQVFGITFTPQLVLGLFLLILLALKLLESYKVRPIPLFGMWAVFVFISTIAFTQSPAITGPIQGVWVVFRLAIVNTLVYPAFWWFYKDPKKVRTFLTVLAASAALSGIIAVVQSVSGGNLLSGVSTNHRFLGILNQFPPEVIQDDIRVVQTHFYYNGIFRGHGTFYRANGFAAFMSIVIGLTWGLLRCSSGKSRWAYVIMFICQCAGVVASLSRTAWVAVVVSLSIAYVLELFFSRRRKQFLGILRMVPLILLLLILAVVTTLQVPSIATRFSTLLKPGDVGQLIWREDIWKQALQTIQENPWLGTGDPIVTSISIGTDDAGFGAHNLLIGIAYETGLPSLAFFMALVIVLFYTAWKSFRFSNKKEDRMVALGIIVGTISFLIAGFGSTIFDIESIAMLFWFLLAAAVNLHQQLHLENNKMFAVVPEGNPS